VPSAEKRVAAAAVSEALAAFEQMRGVGEEQVNQFYAAFAQRLASDPVWEVILEANRIDVEDARRRDRSTPRGRILATFQSASPRPV